MTNPSVINPVGTDFFTIKTINVIGGAPYDVDGAGKSTEDPIAFEAAPITVNSVTLVTAGGTSAASQTYKFNLTPGANIATSAQY